jgi:hypothetical protein
VLSSFIIFNLKSALISHHTRHTAGATTEQLQTAEAPSKLLSKRANFALTFVPPGNLGHIGRKNNEAFPLPPVVVVQYPGTVMSWYQRYEIKRYALEIETIYYPNGSLQ